MGDNHPSPLLYFCSGLAAGLLIGLTAGLALYQQTNRWQINLLPWTSRRSQAQDALESLRRYG